MTMQDARDMIELGDDLLQMYSAFIFEGTKIVEEINKAISK